MRVEHWARRWALAAVALLAAAVPVRAEDAISADDLKAITAKYGGAYADPAVVQYVTDLGNKLVATTPMSGQKFMQSRFVRLPESFQDGVELRATWRAPDTRKKLLVGLAERDLGRDQRPSQPAKAAKVT